MGKQVKILYEHVAVRHRHNLLILPEATFRDKSLDQISEKADQKSAESKYPNCPKFFPDS